MAGCFDTVEVGGAKFYSVGTAPNCTNGWGWLKDGECGCNAEAPGYKQAADGTFGCSVRCSGPGPIQCGFWCALPDVAKYAIYGVGGLAAIGLLFAAFRPRSGAVNGYDYPVEELMGMDMLPAPKRKKRRSKRKK
jgi:hypothetical protein